MARIRGAKIAGFLTLSIGILTVAGLAAPVDDALEDLGRLEVRRRVLTRQADSLGVLHSSLPDEDGREAKEILKRSEELAVEARELDVEILLARQTCRMLAQQELDDRDGAAGGPSSRDLALYDLLENRLSDSWEGRFLLVEPDSLDGLETLLDKRAYLEDLRDRILDLESRVVRRIEKARRERALRAASDQFAEDSRFLDEGGRVGSDETVWMRGIGSEGDPGGEGQGKATPGEGLGFSGDLQTDASHSSEAEGSLASSSWDEVRSRLRADLSRVLSSLEETEILVQRYRPIGP